MNNLHHSQPTPPTTEPNSRSVIEGIVETSLNTMYCDGLEHAAQLAEVALAGGKTIEIPALIRSLKEGKE